MQTSVSPPRTGSLAAIASCGVDCVAPPKGCSTVLAPIEASKRSTKPRWAAFGRAETDFMRSSAVGAEPDWNGFFEASGASTFADAVCVTPLVSRKSRAMSTTRWPRHSMIRRPESVTSATCTASRFSRRAAARKAGTSLGSRTTAMRSCDSERAISEPSRPSYLSGTRSRWMWSEGASSPMATETPPAPKSLQRLIRRLTAGSRKRRCSLRSVGASPFWTSAEFWRAVSVCSFEEPVAPPTPSRPVRPPPSTMTSPGAGTSRRTQSRGPAATTAPISMRLAT